MDVKIIIFLNVLLMILFSAFFILLVQLSYRRLAYRLPIKEPILASFCFATVGVFFNHLIKLVG